MDCGTVVEQGQEHDDAFDNGRPEPSVQTGPAMQLPSLTCFELVLSSRPSGTFRLPYFVRHLARIQERLEGGLVRMRHVVRILGEPVRPWPLHAVLSKIHHTND